MSKKQRKMSEQKRRTQQLGELRSTTLAALGECDELTTQKLNKLKVVGIEPTCSKGCSACCRQEIRVPRAEAEVIVEHVRESFTSEQVEALKQRLLDWIRWMRKEYAALRDGGMSSAEAFYEHGPQCPLLVDNACSAYPMRPIVCRTHFVSSDPRACRQKHDPDYLAAPVALLTSVPLMTQVAGTMIRSKVEEFGGDFLKTVHRLPEWLAHLLQVERDPWQQHEPLEF